jgi:hypothetical protein
MPIGREFSHLLTGEQLEAFERHGESVFGLTARGELAYTNPSWERFARANDGEKLLSAWPLGRCLWDALPPPLAVFYRRAIAAARVSGVVWGHEYECSSPDAFRLFRMEVLPLDEGATVVVNRLRIERPHTAEPHAASPYRDATGLIHQCAHCRCVRVQTDPPVWHFLPALVAKPEPATSHGICDVCLAYYFPE